jgi:hypothetical protein
MLIVAPVKEEIRKAVEAPVDSEDMIPVINQIRSHTACHYPCGL